MVDGRLPVEDANEDLGLEIPESEEYDTLAGWVLSELGHIPEVGELVHDARGELQVVAVRRRRIARLRVTAKREPDDERAPGTRHEEEW
jgi:putative hemolysin